MKDLTYNELLSINGGDNPCGPDADVSNFEAMDAGQGAGYWLGNVVGETIDLIGDVLENINPF